MPAPKSWWPRVGSLVQRKKLFEEARLALEAYAKANANTPAAAQARLEKARIATYEGQALLSLAHRAEDRTSFNNLARQAEDKFKQAGVELDSAFPALPAQDQLMVKFEKAKNILTSAIHSGPHQTSRKQPPRQTH